MPIQPALILLCDVTHRTLSRALGAAANVWMPIAPSATVTVTVVWSFVGCGRRSVFGRLKAAADATKLEAVKFLRFQRLSIQFGQICSPVSTREHFSLENTREERSL